MPHLFTESAAKRIVAATRKSERAGKRGGRAHYDGVEHTPPFWIELTSEDPAKPGRYAWKLIYPKNGVLPADDWADWSPAINSGLQNPADPGSAPVYSAREINGGPGLTGRRVEVKFVGYEPTTNFPAYLFASRLRLTRFDVALAKDGGAANPVSWTYTVTDPVSGLVLATLASPRWRPFTGEVPVPATRGMALYESLNGTIVLAHAEEVYGDTSCNTLDEGSASA